MNDCSRGCCWTPYTCAKGRRCPCHPAPQTQSWAELQALLRAEDKRNNNRPHNDKRFTRG